MSYVARSMTVFELMESIDEYYLPAIQREFVWQPEQIEALFDSLLRGYPIGTLLLWDVRKPAIHDFQFYKLFTDYDVRRTHNSKADLTIRERCSGVLDGQQRLTSLSIGLLGSYTLKRPRMRWSNPDAFQKRKLYINLLYQPAPDSDQRFQIKFLASEQARPTSDAYWFRIGEILMYKTRNALRDFLRSTPHRDNDVFENALDLLWTAIYKQDAISYFAESEQDLDAVLQIFVRLNSGGTPLSYSDLLLSLATATWKQHDARELIYGLVDQLNSQLGSFNFSKDFVLKTLLMASDGDVRFKTANIRRRLGLEELWPAVSAAIKTTVRLLRSFGFDAATLTAPNAVISIAYYLFKRQLGDGFVSQKGHAAERETIRVWLLKMLLGQAFSGQSDQTLTIVREAISNTLAANAQSPFPAEAIIQELAARQGFAFTGEMIEALAADTSYGSARAFAILALLAPGLSFEHTSFHLDHLHPASRFTRRRLAEAGLPPEDVEFAMETFNTLPNLHLLPDARNVSKQDQPLAQWLPAQPDLALLRSLSLIPAVDLELRSYRAFYDARRRLLSAALRERLGMAAPAAAPHSTDLITGQAADLG